MRSHIVLGFRAHSGWAAMIAVGGAPDEPRVLDRRRLELIDPGGLRQPFHAAEDLAFTEAEKLIEASRVRSRELARAAMGEIGYRAYAAVVLEAAGRPLPDLAAILASHALIHTAEGEHFREVLRDGCRHHGIRVTGCKERDLAAKCEEALPSGYSQHLTMLGRELGPPWRQDEKYATLAAWLELRRLT